MLFFSQLLSPRAGNCRKVFKIPTLFCQNPAVSQSFVMGKPEIETIKEKSQPGSFLSELICILNGSRLKGDTFCKHKPCWVIQDSTFSSPSPPPSSENARSPNGSTHRAVVLYTKEQQEIHIGGWLFFLVKSSNACGRGIGVRQVQAIGFCVLCVLLAITFSRPWTLPRAHSGKGRASQNLQEKHFCERGIVVGWILSPRPPPANHVQVEPQIATLFRNRVFTDVIS